MPGGYPGQFGQFPGGFGSSGQYPGQQNNQPRDGFTQRDYYGGFGQLGARQRSAPGKPAVPGPASTQASSTPGQPYPGQHPGHPGQPSHAAHSGRSRHAGQPQPGRSRQASTRRPPAPPCRRRRRPATPQGFRARKLAELDQRYSDGELTMEDYMAQRAEIMKG